MTRTLAYSLIVFLACLSPQAQADKPTAGMYSITTSMESDTGVLVQTDTMTECLTEEDVQRDPDAFVGGREGTENCEVGDYSMEGGKMNMSMICQTPAGELTMKTDGTFHTTGLPIKLSDTPGAIERRPPLHGEHSDEILAEFGLDAREIAQLREAKII